MLLEKRMKGTWDIGVNPQERAMGPTQDTAAASVGWGSGCHWIPLVQAIAKSNFHCLFPVALLAWV